MKTAQPEEYDWTPFVGRALAFLCLHFASPSGATVLDRANFLMGLGLPRREAAVVLGSSDESLQKLAKRAAGKAPPRRGRGPAAKEEK